MSNADNIDKILLRYYIENLEEAIRYLIKINTGIKYSLFCYKEGIPINIVGHMSLAIGGFTREKKGLSLYDYLENKTGIMPQEITQLHRCKSTMQAAEYLQALLDLEYYPKLEKMNGLA
jgi:hypothetical protein